MKLITVNVDKDNFATICCPNCEAIKKVSAEKFKGKKHKITIHCKCEKRFGVQLNFRKYYRKTVAIPGEVMISSSNMFVWRKINVCDLSMTGLNFKFIEPAIINKGDILRVSFRLETKKSVLLDEEVVVISLNGNLVRCKYTNLSPYDNKLGFFLFP